MLHFTVSYTIQETFSQSTESSTVFLTLPITEINKQDNSSGTVCQRPIQDQKEQMSISQDLNMLHPPKTEGTHRIFPVQV